jgi:hypothetical protein
VSPPFCEAHNHNLGLGDLPRNQLALYNYLRDGVFYVKTLSNLPRESAAVRFASVCSSRACTKVSRRRR